MCILKNEYNAKKVLQKIPEIMSIDKKYEIPVLQNIYLCN